MVVVAIIVSGH